MTKNKLGYKPMPEPAYTRSGCKVAWYYYATEKEAKAAAEIARWNAKIDASLGYDFGYCCPGEIMKPDKVAQYNRAEGRALWEVCVS